jgi:RNA polymerase sigma-70 factor, ECF subfamily
MAEAEEELVKLARLGDEAAFAALVQRYQGMVYNLAYARLGDAEAAADATQETFLRAWRGLPGFAGLAAFSTWLYTIAHRTCLTMAARRQKTIALTEIPEPVAGEESDPVAITLNRQDAAALRKALLLLPAPMRTALTLYHFHNRTYEEISRITGEPLGTVRTRLHRGRARLKALLGQEGRDTECIAE